MEKIVKTKDNAKNLYPGGEYLLGAASQVAINAVEDKKVGDHLVITFGDGEDVHEFGVKCLIKDIEKNDATEIESVDGDYYYAVTLEKESIVKLSNIDIQLDAIVADIEDVTIEDGDGNLQELKETLRQTFIKTDTTVRYFKEDFEIVDAFNEFNRKELYLEVARNYGDVDYGVDKVIISDADITKKYDAVIQMVERAAMRAKVKEEISQKASDEREDANRKYVLQEEMRIIQEELGQGSDIVREADKFEEKVKKSKMPKELKAKCLEEVKRYRTMNAQHPDTNNIRQFLEHMISLPWEAKQEEELDLKKVKEKLEASHHGLTKVKERIMEYLAVKKNVDKAPNTIICLQGPPGVGKTSISNAIAEALGRKLVKHSLGGISDENEIRGHRRTYIGAMPGRIIKGMIEAGTTNPVFLLDEIDKMGKSLKGDPAAAMLEVLDPAQNSKFRDNYLGEEYDLSKVMFIATSNYLENIPHALRDRMEVIHIDPYMKEDKIHIAQKHIISKQLEEHGLKEDQLSFTKEAIDKIIEGYTREAGVRNLTKAIAKVCRKATSKIVIDGEKSIKVDEKDVVDYLDKELIRPLENEIKGAQVGMVNGLSYNSGGGGSCLPIEAATYPGKGKWFVTPSAKEANSMMTDSLKTIISVLRLNREKLGIDKDFDFDKTDIHVNYAGNQQIGGVDGPSAGNAMALAILSSITGRKLKADFAITGAIDLRGNARAIGGVKEKALGAASVGIKTMYLPEENLRDVEDITPDVREKLEVKTYKHFLDVASEVLVEEKGQFIELFESKELKTVSNLKVAAVAKSK